jgi:xanthine dehydrogenase accessory factor
MTNWLSFFNEHHSACVLVTIAHVEGSAPREAGAKMVVTADAQFDTIGGGHLEMRACDVARTMLSTSVASFAAERRLERIALGPSLGQCCGGVVHLVFELIDLTAQSYVDSLRTDVQKQQDCWRIVALDSAVQSVVIDRHFLSVAEIPAGLVIDFQRPCHIRQDHNGARWLIDPCLAHRHHVVLFGAGHVGAALVRALGDLPCNITWIDEREDMFPTVIPNNVTIEVSDAPEAFVDRVNPDTFFLVMTHSHALDQRLAECILRRADIGWFGLIGSLTKRKQFEHRLRERGIDDARLAQMTCPIGIEGISGKEPAVIAASVCAQLLRLWDK